MSLDRFKRPQLIDKDVDGRRTMGAKWYNPGLDEWYGVWGYYDKNRDDARHEIYKYVSHHFTSGELPSEFDNLSLSSDAGGPEFDVG